QTGKLLAERRAHLVTVAAAAARDPDVRERGMAIDDVVPVRTVFVLTDPRPEHRRVRESREAAGHDFAKCAFDLARWIAVAISWIEGRPAAIVRNLEPTVQVARYAVDEAVARFDPDRELGFDESIVACRRAEVENFLARRLHTRPNHVWEDPPKPTATGEHGAPRP